MRYLWRSLDPEKNSCGLVKEAAELHPVISRCIALRLGQSCTETDVRHYLDPRMEQLYDPYLLKEMEKAVDIINDMVKNNQPILIYGDYDVDGITSTALLVGLIRELGGDVDWFIPNRIDDGYGLNEESVKAIAARGAALMITVDCGISAVNSVKYAVEMGMKVIITDHHVPGTELPEADAVINPKIGDYPFRDLAGVGVAFKLASALDRGLSRKYADLAALGTIADIVPLLGENRILVKYGLSHVENKGLQLFLEHLSLDTQKVKASAVSFKIAPRIINMGRLKDSKELVNLFLSHDESKIHEFLEKMEETNKKRRLIAYEVEREAMEKAHGLPWDESNIIVLHDDKWHHGVLGIAASRLTEEYHRPVLLLSGSEEGLSKGSGRSIHGLDLLGLLRSCERMFERLGGHSQAAGCTLKTENIPLLSRELNRSLAEEGNEIFLPWKNYDAEMEPDEIAPDFFSGLKVMEPFGCGNPQPLLKFRGMKIGTSPRIFKDKHISFDMKGRKEAIRVIGFGKAHYSSLLSPEMDVLGYIDKKQFNNREYEEISLTDLMESHGDVSRKTLAAAYGYLKRNNIVSYHSSLVRLKGHMDSPGTAMKIFEELGIIKRYGDRIKFCDRGDSFDLEDSAIFRAVTEKSHGS